MKKLTTEQRILAQSARKNRRALERAVKKNKEASVKLEMKKDRLLQPIYEKEKELSEARTKLHSQLLMNYRDYGFDNVTHALNYFLSL